MRVAVGDVLQHVEAHDDVEAPIGERQRGAGDLLNGELAEPGPSLVDQPGVDVDALDPAAPRAQAIEQRTGAGADLENLGVRAQDAGRLDEPQIGFEISVFGRAGGSAAPSPRPARAEK